MTQWISADRNFTRTWQQLAQHILVVVSVHVRDVIGAIAQALAARSVGTLRCVSNMDGLIQWPKTPFMLPPGFVDRSCFIPASVRKNSKT